jgi:hypothetical protein
MYFIVLSASTIICGKTVKPFRQLIDVAVMRR